VGDISFGCIHIYWPGGSNKIMMYKSGMCDLDSSSTEYSTGCLGSFRSMLCAKLRDNK
jgi:hypothetical protein